MLQDQLLAEWNQLEYYHLPFPKSLGREWFLESFEPIWNNYQLDIKDLLRTATEHISDQLANFIRKIETGTKAKILLTGGGAYNDFLIKKTKPKASWAFRVSCAI
jgi:anhydro-N-acetylmuramic acid kinase